MKYQLNPNAFIHQFPNHDYHGDEGGHNGNKEWYELPEVQSPRTVNWSRATFKTGGAVDRALQTVAQLKRR